MDENTSVDAIEFFTASLIDSTMPIWKSFKIRRSSIFPFLPATNENQTKNNKHEKKERKRMMKWHEKKAYAKANWHEIVGRICHCSHCISPGLILGVFMPFVLKISINSNRRVLISWRISITSSSVIPKSSRFRCSAVIKRRTSKRMTLSWRFFDLSCDLFCTYKQMMANQKKRVKKHTTRSIRLRLLKNQMKWNLCEGKKIKQQIRIPPINCLSNGFEESFIFIFDRNHGNLSI